MVSDKIFQKPTKCIICCLLFPDISIFELFWMMIYFILFTGFEISIVPYCLFANISPFREEFLSKINSLNPEDNREI